jgi:sirohydrochlorin cobaltochelatase
VKACFVAIANPSLEETLRGAKETDFQRIVVQPHLLFAGDVLAEITTTVEKARKQQPDRQWILTPHLGPSPLVADAILDLARTANGQISTFIR